jgi:hypothetical protein
MSSSKKQQQSLDALLASLDDSLAVGGQAARTCVGGASRS